MFVDSDDFMESKEVSCVIEANTELKADVVIFNYYKVASNHKIKCDSVSKGLQTKETFLANSYNNLNTVYYYKIYNKLYKREIIIGNKIYFPETINMGEDFRFNLLYFSHCKYFLMIENYLYNYRIDNEQSLMHTINRLSASSDIEEIYSTLNFFRDNLNGFDLCEKGLDRYILDKINGYVILNYRTSSKNFKEISVYLKKVKNRYIIKDFSSVKFSWLMRLAWKVESGMILYIRQVLIDTRYRMIIKIKGE